MNVKEAIGKRRSIRKYLNKPVPDELIREIIDAARLAPSGNNAQPSRYKIIKDDETKKILQDNNTIRDKWVYSAPVIVVCCADPKAYKKFVRGWDDPDDLRARRDETIASSYLMLRATELGLGTCYCGWIKKEKIKDVLNIPKDYLIQYVIGIGYPAEKPKAKPRKNIEEIMI